MLSVFFPSFLRSSSVCAVTALTHRHRTAAADAMNFMSLPCWLGWRAMSVRFSIRHGPKPLMLHLQRLAVNGVPVGFGLKERRYHWPAASMNSTPIGQLRVQLITAIAVIMVSIWGAVAYQVVSERQSALHTAAQNGR